MQMAPNDDPQAPSHIVERLAPLLVTSVPTWQCADCVLCQVCGKDSDEDTEGGLGLLYVCDGCGLQWHLDCYRRGKHADVDTRPGEWFCVDCEAVPKVINSLTFFVSLYLFFRCLTSEL